MAIRIAVPLALASAIIVFAGCTSLGDRSDHLRDTDTRRGGFEQRDESSAPSRDMPNPTNDARRRAPSRGTPNTPTADQPSTLSTTEDNATAIIDTTTVDTAAQ